MMGTEEGHTAKNTVIVSAQEVGLGQLDLPYSR